MGCRYECKKYGTKRFKCCIECEHYKYCNNRNSVCDRIHFHEYMEECQKVPYFVAMIEEIC